MLSGQPNPGAFKKCYLCLGTCVTHVFGLKTYEEGTIARLVTNVRQRRASL